MIIVGSRIKPCVTVSKNTHQCKSLSWKTTKVKRWGFWSELSCGHALCHTPTVLQFNRGSQTHTMMGPYLLLLGRGGEQMACVDCELNGSSAGESMYQKLGRGHVKAMRWSHIIHIMSRGGKLLWGVCSEVERWDFKLMGLKPELQRVIVGDGVWKYALIMISQ